MARTFSYMPHFRLRLLLFLRGVSLLALSPALHVAALCSGRPGDPVCGDSAGLRYYSEAVDVKSGPCVDLVTREARDGEPVALRFYVSEKRSGTPLEDLKVQHEKL